MEILSVVVIKNYRNQGQRPRNREKDIGSQHCGKMVLNIILHFSTVTVKNITKKVEIIKSVSLYTHTGSWREM